MDIEDNKFLNLEYHLNFLTEVIFRIDYSPILKISESIPIALQDKIRVLMPEFKENKIYGLKATINKKDKVFKKEEEIKPEWQFTDKEKTKITNLSQDSLSIIIKKYKNFKEYKDFIMKIVNFFYEEYKPIEVKRLGLRYITYFPHCVLNGLKWV